MFVVLAATLAIADDAELSTVLSLVMADVSAEEA